MTDDTTITITLQDETQPGHRHCGGCTLCCRLLPMKSRPHFETMETVKAMIRAGMARPEDFAGMIPEFDKPAGERCRPHQRTGKGCAIYERRPVSCRLWSCRWLTGDDTADLRRPDRSRYVIDITEDYVTATPHDGSPAVSIKVVQVWVDPLDRKAWRDPALLAYLDRSGKQGIAAIIRWDAGDAMILIPPSMTGSGEWREVFGEMTHEHTAEERVQGLAEARKVIFG